MKEVTYKLSLSYEGSAFKGWQRQGQAPTVQLKLEEAISACWGKIHRVHGSGRTDTGVHAWEQIAHFRAEGKFNGKTLRKALNNHLPPEIRVLSAVKVKDDFHSRFSATGKEYVYRVFNHEVMSPFELGRAWHVYRKLDVTKMRKAAACLIGKHDFASFTSNPGYERATTVREMKYVRIQREGDVVTFRFRANGFLYRMVRNLMGALIKVGIGKLEAEEMEKILKARKRSAAPNTAPACGLYLAKVYYGRK